MSKKLPREFYIETDAIEAAKKLLGKELITEIHNERTSGIITETEAYMGEIDKACHSYGGKKTERTQVLYKKGGKAYVYLVYGMHYLLNATVGEEGVPECVLIRSIFPLEGIDVMKWRRFGNDDELQNRLKLANGPAKLTQAMGINKDLYGQSLRGRKIWIEEGIEVKDDEIISSPRVGIEYAEEFKGKEWRFVVENKVVEARVG
jgi:DNA-3-methyladenine glycosylase